MMSYPIHNEMDLSRLRVAIAVQVGGLGWILFQIFTSFPDSTIATKGWFLAAATSFFAFFAGLLSIDFLNRKNSRVEVKDGTILLINQSGKVIRRGTLTDLAKSQIRTSTDPKYKAFVLDFHSWVCVASKRIVFTVDQAASEEISREIEATRGSYAVKMRKDVWPYPG